MPRHPIGAPRSRLVVSPPMGSADRKHFARDAHLKAMALRLAPSKDTYLPFAELLAAYTVAINAASRGGLSIGRRVDRAAMAIKYCHEALEAIEKRYNDTRQWSLTDEEDGYIMAAAGCLEQALEGLPYKVFTTACKEVSAVLGQAITENPVLGGTQQLNEESHG